MAKLPNKKKVNRRNNNKRGIIAQWGVPVAILFFVLVVLISNFSIISRNSAKESISKKLIADSVTYASDINNLMENVTYAGKAAASIIGDKGMGNYRELQEYARLIKESVSEPYMVIVVDMEGKGSSNAKAEIDISKMSYYTTVSRQTYLFTEDDGILGAKAYVSIIPIQKNNTTIGMIYMFIDNTQIQLMLPEKEYDSKASFAIIDVSGDIKTTAGEPSYYTDGTNFLDNVNGAQLLDMVYSKISMRVGKQMKFTFSTSKTVGDTEEKKTIVTVPIGIGNWEYVTVLNQDYVNVLQFNEWTNARNMVIRMILTVLAFLGIIVILSIINKVKYNEKSKDLADKADTDLLTELNNKMATERKIQEFINENPDAQCLMFLFDIDNFKKINDTMGHAFGDEVLRSLGQQLKNEFRVSDIIGRTGGDEFMIFLKYIKDDEQLQREGTRLSNFFHQFKAGEYVKYSATASIGATVYPRDAKDFHSLYKAADNALYEAKRRGKNQLVFYNKELESNSTESKRKDTIDSDNR